MGSSITDKQQGAGIGLKTDITLAVIFISLLIFSSAYQYNSQQSMVEAMVLDQAQAQSDSFFDNINTLMLTGQMSKQDIARNKTVSRANVNDVRVLRAESVSKLYGPGRDSAQAVDALDKGALAGKPQQQIIDGP